MGAGETKCLKACDLEYHLYGFFFDSTNTHNGERYSEHWIIAQAKMWCAFSANANKQNCGRMEMWKRKRERTTGWLTVAQKTHTGRNPYRHILALIIRFLFYLIGKIYYLISDIRILLWHRNSIVDTHTHSLTHRRRGTAEKNETKWKQLACRIEQFIERIFCVCGYCVLLSLNHYRTRPFKIHSHRF